MFIFRDLKLLRILNKPLINLNIDVYGDITSYLEGSRYGHYTSLRPQ